MARSIWKGPFVDGYLLKKAEAARGSGRSEVIKIWSRRSTILPQFVGLTFNVYNGQKHIPVYVTEELVVVVLGVGDRALEALLDLDGDALLRELQVGERGRDLLAPDQLRHEVQLLRADAQHTRDGLRLVLGERAGCCCLAHLSASSPFCRRRGR